MITFCPDAPHVIKRMRNCLASTIRRAAASRSGSAEPTKGAEDSLLSKELHFQFVRPLEQLTTLSALSAASPTDIDVFDKLRIRFVAPGARPGAASREAPGTTSASDVQSGAGREDNVTSRAPSHSITAAPPSSNDHDDNASPAEADDVSCLLSVSRACC
jgi:hypothetical protein